MKNLINNNYIIKTIKPFIKEQNEHAYIVGGFLRDCMLNKESCDVDIVVAKGHAKVFSTKLADYIKGYFVELDTINNIYRVVFADKENYVDIADCTADTIENDLKRRDFTINALAFDMLNEELIDVVNAKQDLKNGIIREISKENMLDDSIRILRAFRFHSQLGFVFSEDLKNIIKEHAQEIRKPAKERVNTELIKLFGGKNAHDTIRLLDMYKILEILIPEVLEIKKVPPNNHHHLDLFNHSIETLKQVQLFYEQSQDWVKEHLDENFGVAKRIGYLKFATFLHDIGKPSTWQIDDTGRHRFIMHDSVGAKIVVPRLKDLKFSKKQIAYVQKIIKYHMYPAFIVTAEEATEKTFLRFFRKIENDCIDLIAIAHADRLSTKGPDITEKMINDNINGLKNLLNEYKTQKESLKPLPKLLDGVEIMELLDIKPSQTLGNIIKQLKEAQMSLEVNTKEEAISFVKSIYKSEI
jgi:tRNA nucleotidyltransferase/poly(A) polymerase